MIRSRMVVISSKLAERLGGPFETNLHLVPGHNNIDGKERANELGSRGSALDCLSVDAIHWVRHQMNAGSGLFQSHNRELYLENCFSIKFKFGLDSPGAKSANSPHKHDLKPQMLSNCLIQMTRKYLEQTLLTTI